VNVVLISVPHTGTWFTIRLLTAAGLRETHLNPAKIEDGHVYHGHMLKGTQTHAAMRLATQMPLVCPLRHPFRVEESWRRKGKDIGYMIECFRIYQDKFLPLDPLVMPVDSPKKNHALSELSAGLGLDLATDWSVVNGKSGTDGLDLTEFDPSPGVVDLVSEMHPFLARYYDDTTRKEDAHKRHAD
jgi:hypothetical protein